ncbi:MAG: hypothetical protein ABIS01_01520, partial [Ferruginibacter sp.]
MYIIEDLIQKYNSGKCTAEEKIWLEQWYHSFEWNSKSDLLADTEIERLKNEVWTALQKSKVHSNKIKTIRVSPKVMSVLKWWQYAAAAIFIGCTGVASFYLFQPAKQIVSADKKVNRQQIHKEVKPGT